MQNELQKKRNSNSLFAVSLILFDPHHCFLGEILENAAFFSVRIQDIPSFERFLAQLKTYYYDYA